MENLYGPITPTLIAVTASLLIQVIKKLWGLNDLKAFVLSIFVAFVFTAPFQLLTELGTMTTDPTWIDVGLIVYRSIFYSINVLLSVLGVYGGAKFLASLKGKDEEI